MSRGLFLVFEGVEGAGKSTQARLLAQWLQEAKIPFILAREPGGTPVGERIREVVLDRGTLRMPPETELLLILAARAAFVREVVRPALDRGDVVLADRFDLSTLAYQGFGRGLELGEVRRLNAFATGGVRPDLCLVLDLPVEEGLKRKEGSGVADRIEREGRSFLERVREGYRELARGAPGARLLNASGSPREVAGAVLGALREAFPETFGNRGV